MKRWQQVFFLQPVMDPSEGCVGSQVWRTAFHYDIVVRLLFIMSIPLLFYFSRRRLRLASLYLLTMACVFASQLIGERVPDPSRCGELNFPAGHVVFHVAACGFLFLACHGAVAWTYLALSAAVLVSTCMGAYHSWLQLFAGAAVGAAIVLAQERSRHMPRWTWALLALAMLGFIAQTAFRYPFERWIVGASAAFVLYHIIKRR